MQFETIFSIHPDTCCYRTFNADHACHSFIPIAISNGDAVGPGEHIDGAGAARRSTAACSAASREPLCTPTSTSRSIARVHSRIKTVGSMLDGAPDAIADTAVNSSAVSSGAVRMRRSTACTTALMSDGGHGEYLHSRTLSGKHLRFMTPYEI